jgi:hypothetical protein
VAVSRPLRRLLGVLEIEEEQCRVALESALSEMIRLERALAGATERERSGRRLVVEGARSGDFTDRLAGLEEARAGRRGAAFLTPQIASAERDAGRRREEFLAKRVERRQVETLLQEAEARDGIAAGRRSQQGLDDWYLNRQHRREAAKETSASPAAGGVPKGTVFAADENLSKYPR